MIVKLHFIFSPNSDLVSVLKQMLGFYIKHSMHLPMKLTFESLVDLCQAEYMNPESLKNMIDKTNLDIHHPSVISRYGMSKIELKL